MECNEYNYLRTIPIYTPNLIGRFINPTVHASRLSVGEQRELDDDPPRRLQHEKS